MGAISAHSSPTKLQPSAAAAVVASPSSSASSQQQQHLGMLSLSLTSTWPHLRCDVGLEQREYQQALAKRLRDASCLSVVSFNSTKRQAHSSIIIITIFSRVEFTTAYIILFGVFTGAWLSVPYTDLHRDCDTPLDGPPSVYQLMVVRPAPAGIDR